MQAGDLAVPSEAVDEIAANKVESTYVVMMAGIPVASYTGGVAGYAATRPADGEKLDTAKSDVRRYRDYLRGRGNAGLASAGISTTKKVYDYGLTFNGFSVRLTGLEAAKLSAQPGVVAIVEDELRTLDTSPPLTSSASPPTTVPGISATRARTSSSAFSTRAFAREPQLPTHRWPVRAARSVVRHLPDG